MKYRLMGIEKTLGNTGMKTRFIGMQNGIIVKHEFIHTDESLSINDLINILIIKLKLKIGDICIPKHIINTLKERE